MSKKKVTLEPIVSVEKTLTITSICNSKTEITLQSGEKLVTLCLLPNSKTVLTYFDGIENQLSRFLSNIKFIKND